LATYYTLLETSIQKLYKDIYSFAYYQVALLKWIII